MERSGRGGHVLEIAEYAAGGKAIEYFGIERSLSRVREMMDGKARYDGVERAIRRRERGVQVVPDDGDRRVGAESGFEAVEHRF